ncbi:MAG: response regulator transcription factor [Candidatus Methylumidiphilus sp.]
MNILLVDDDDCFRQGLADYLPKVKADLHIFQARNCDEAIALAHDNPMDLVFLDLKFHNHHNQGFHALLALKKAFESLCIVIVTGADTTRELVVECLSKGAMGVIQKGPREDYREAFEAVLSGRPVLPRLAMRTEKHCAPSERLLPDLSNTDLSTKQRELLVWIVKGLSYKDIAKALGKSEQYVKNQASAIFAKFGVKTKAQLIVELFRREWMP